MAAFARKIERHPEQVSQWLKGRRAVGERTARHIEGVLDLEPGAMDRPLPQASDIVREVRRITRAPLLHLRAVRTYWSSHKDWTRLEMDAELLDYRPVPIVCSELTYAVPITGTAMEPELRDGEEAFVDPAATPAHRDLVLVDHPMWPEPRVRRLQLEGGESFLVAANPQWPEPFLSAEGVEILGVVVYIGRPIRR